MDDPAGGAEALIHALESDDPQVRRAAAERATDLLVVPDRAPDAFDRYKDAHAIAAALRDFPNSMIAQVDMLSPSVKQHLAANQNAPNWLLRRLAVDEDDLVREEVAANPVTAGDLLETLAGDGYLPTRAGVAGNPSTPPRVVAAMAEDPEYAVFEILADRPDLPDDVRDRLNSEMPGTQWPCVVCGRPGGDAVVVESEFIARLGTPVVHDRFVERFPVLVASWCMTHAQTWSITIETRESSQKQKQLRPDRAPEPDRLAEGFELFYRRPPNAAASDHFLGGDAQSRPYYMWSWMHVARSLSWWLAGQGELRCGQRGPYLAGSWDCDEAAASVVGDRRWGSDYGVCAAHEANPPDDLSWAGRYAGWDAAVGRWVDHHGPLVRPDPWAPPGR